ncbi:unnamed protein product [Rhodiola kirilowii]
MKGGGSSYALPAKEEVEASHWCPRSRASYPCSFLSHSCSVFITDSSPLVIQGFSMCFLAVDESDASITRKEWESDNLEHVERIMERMGTDNPKVPMHHQTLPKPIPIPDEDSASGDHPEATSETTTNAVEERPYYPSVAKLPGAGHIVHELKQNIQEFEHIFSEAIYRCRSPSSDEDKVQKMEAAIAKAKVVVADCNNVDKKLQQLVDLTEDEARFHMNRVLSSTKSECKLCQKVSTCLFMRLTVEYFQSTNDIELPLDEKFMNPSLEHYVLFSKNVLAASVVINSTVMHAKETRNQVFHILTDRQNYFAMKFWFYKAIYQKATVEVLNIEELELPDNATLQLHLPEEYRVSVHGLNNSRSSQIRTEYISVFSHSHYFLPEIFHYLKKIVVLDDDVVIKRDLSALWSLDMEGKVNGAVEGTRYKWNIQQFDARATIIKSVLGYSSTTVQLSLFQNQVFPLDDTWALSGLGHDYEVNAESVENAAVLHYNGNMKPWLDLGISSYKSYWKSYLDSENQFLSQCNVNS